MTAAGNDQGRGAEKDPTGFVKVEHASLSDVGVRRSHNQDSCAALLATEPEQWRRGGHVFVVADGMGAHAVGELASELAASIIPHTYYKYAPEGASPALCKAFVEANASIHARGQQNQEFKGMGTTSTALVLRDDGAWVGHVGDSRAYRVRGGKINQLSFDHSLAWELARRQGVSPDSLEGIPSNVIVRSLGPEALVQVDVEGPHMVQDGDIYVLCSDGLSNLVPDHEIGAVSSTLPPAEACRFLVDQANLRGGLDNITVVIARVGGGSATESEADREGPAWEKPWFLRIPWPIGFLVLGVLFAAGAATLLAFQIQEGKMAFYLAALSLMVGLGGLIYHHHREKNQPAEEQGPPPLHVYREHSCLIDKEVVEKMAKTETALEQWVREKKWEVDWSIYQQHHELAERQATEGNFAGAFREYCRAMRPLNESIHLQRHKSEVFQPNWDKHTKGKDANRG